MKIFSLALATCFFLTLAACASSASIQALTESIWVLKQLDGVEPLAGIAITAQFEQDGKVAGSAGCNSYNTTYTVDGNKIQFGELAATTMMACPDPIMQQERNYLDVLTKAATFEIADDELTLFDSGGNTLAVFFAQSQELAGSSWDVIAYNNGREAVVSVIIDSQITARFGEDGQLTGSAGCNDYIATYETDGDKIRIGSVEATEMFCSEPEGIMEQEKQYLLALETAATYRVGALDMDMRTEDGARVASFKRALTP